MELEELKASWNAAGYESKTNIELLEMLNPNNHPVLKGIRKQIIIEVLGWTLLLVCFYTMFDGGEKPFLINLFLIVSILGSLGHNIYGYKLSKRVVHGDTLVTSVTNYMKKTKWYAVQSVFLRIVFASALLTFLTHNIALNSKKFLLMGIVICIVIFQIFLLCALWMKRYKTLDNTLAAFKG